VIEHPGPLPFWKRLPGRKNLVERLIESGQRITIVVLDTRKHETKGSRGSAQPRE
jgi:hypothetical protein